MDYMILESFFKGKFIIPAWKSNRGCYDYCYLFIIHVWWSEGKKISKIFIFNIKKYMINFKNISLVSETHQIKRIFLDEYKNNFSKEISDILSHGQHINYFEKDTTVLDKENIIHWWAYSYLISPISEQDKYSLWYQDCQWFSALGISKKNWKNISFFTHQDTKLLLEDKNKREEFFEKTCQQLENLRKQTVSDSIQTAIFWGNGFFIPKHMRDRWHILWYLNGLEIMNNVTQKVLWHYPIILHHPNQYWGKNDIYLYTQENIFLIWDSSKFLAKSLDYYYKPFTWENIEEMKELWQATQYKGV